jgi:hypothetical protein
MVTKKYSWLVFGDEGWPEFMAPPATTQAFLKNFIGVRCKNELSNADGPGFRASSAGRFGPDRRAVPFRADGARIFCRGNVSLH